MNNLKVICVGQGYKHKHAVSLNKNKYHYFKFYIHCTLSIQAAAIMLPSADFFLIGEPAGRATLLQLLVYWLLVRLQQFMIITQYVTCFITYITYT